MPLCLDCSRRYDVVNRGFSGYNTSQALKILEQVFPKPEAGGPNLKYLVSLTNHTIWGRGDGKHPQHTNPSLQVVLLGANDAALQQEVDNQGVPLEEYKTNLRRIITHPHVTAHAPQVLVVTPPPLDEIRTTELDVPKYGRGLRQTARSAAYSQAARDVAASVAGVKVVDLQRALLDVAAARTPGWDAATQPPLGSSAAGGQRGYLETLLPDGLHLGGEAYRVFFGLVAAEIKLPGADAEGYVHPEWRRAPWLKE